MHNVLSLFAPELVILNGNLITMDPYYPRAEALAVQNGTIIKIGENEDIKHLISTKTHVIDLKGKTILPGFIESHTHLIYYGNTLSQLDCRTPPNKTIDDILTKIKDEADKKPHGEWIRGYGYDDTLLKEFRHPSKWDLDTVAPNHPVYITHISGHLIAVNSYALRLANIDETTIDPPGGIIFRGEGSREPNGVLAEPPAMDMVTKLFPPTTVDDLKEAIRKANNRYLSMGVTSIHEAGVGLFLGDSELKAYIEASEEGILQMRAYLMLYYTFFKDLLNLNPEGLKMSTGSEYGKIKIGPVKVLQDGSIQGLTAALQQPYHCKPEYKGGLILSQEELENICAKAYSLGFQLSVHGNGDACIESILQAYKKTLGSKVKNNHRFRIEHCQTVTEEQLNCMSEMGILASFFPVHTYYWGDRHKKIFLGPERAERIDPLNSALRRGIIFGMHNDCPVTEINPFMSIYAAANRITREGHTLGEHETIAVEQAIKAMTIGSAYLAFEENIKGSLSPGKVADMIVVNENPLQINKKDIKDLYAEMTIIGGGIVYSKT